MLKNGNSCIRYYTDCPAIGSECIKIRIANDNNEDCSKCDKFSLIRACDSIRPENCRNKNTSCSPSHKNPRYGGLVESMETFQDILSQYIITNGEGDRIMTSSDGIDWTMPRGGGAVHRGGLNPVGEIFLSGLTPYETITRAFNSPNIAVIENNQE